MHLDPVGFHHIVIITVGDTFELTFHKTFKDKNLHNLLWEVGCALDPEVYKAKRVELKDACEDTET